MSVPEAEVEPEVTEELQESPIVEERDLIAELLELPTKFIKRPCQLATARALVLENKGIGDNEALSLAEALRRGAMPRLEWLRLAHNSIGDLGCEALIVGITGYYEHLIHHFKNMVYVHDGRRIDIQGLDGLKRTGNPTIFFLLQMDLSFNRIQAPGVFSIAAAVGKGLLAHLLHLNLSNNDIGEEGVESLMKSLESNNLQRLEKLGLAHNNIGEKGLKALCRALMDGNLPSLLDLDLRGNGIGEQGALRMAIVLQSGHPPRQHLDLTGNRVGKKGAHAFVEAFKLNPGLETQVELNWISFHTQRKAGTYRLRNRRFLRRFEVLMYEEESEASRGKVILCGNSGVGKSTLRRSLEAGQGIIKRSIQKSLSFFSKLSRDPYCLLEWKRSFSRGIEVGYIDNIDDDEDDEYTLSTMKIWDFRGQPELRVLHSRFLRDFLLAERKTASFVVVCRAEMNSAGPVPRDAEDELTYWLRFIASGAIDGMKRSVIIVLNRFEGQFDADVSAGLKDNYQGWVSLIARMHAKFQDSLDIHLEPFVVDARSSESVLNLKWHLIEYTNSLLQGYGSEPTGFSCTEPTVCQVLREKAASWATKSCKPPVLSWSKLKLKFARLGFSPRELRAAAEYLEEVGDIILFREIGSESEDDEEDDSGEHLVLSSEWFWGTIAKRLLAPDEYPTVALRNTMEQLGYATTEDISSVLRYIAATDASSKHMRVEYMLAVLMRLGLCYRVGPEKLIIPALLDVGHRGHLGWWDQVGTQCVLGRSYKLMDSDRTALPLALFYELQMELAIDPTFGGHADSEFRASQSHLTCKCLCMALLVECFIDERDPRNDRIDVLVKPLVEKRDVAHGRAWRDQQIQLIECVYDLLQLLTVQHFPRVEFADYILQPWRAAIGTVPIRDRNAEIAVEDLKRLVFEDGPKRSESPRWRLTEGIFEDEELLSGTELQEIQILVDDQCYLARQAMVDLGLSRPEDLDKLRIRDAELQEEIRIAQMQVAPSPLQRSPSQISRSQSQMQRTTSFSDFNPCHVPAAVHDVNVQGHCLGDMDNRKIIELAQKMPELRIELAKAFQKRRQLIGEIQSLEQCYVDEKEHSVPRFMYIASSSPSEAQQWPYTMHFLCEIQHSGTRGGILHEVRGQKGLHVHLQHSKKWLQKSSPYLKWSLTVLNLLATLGGLVVQEKLHFIPPHSDWQVGRLADRIANQVEALMKNLQLENDPALPDISESDEEDSQETAATESDPEISQQSQYPYYCEDQEEPALPSLKEILLEALEEDLLQRSESGNSSSPIPHATAIYNRFGLRPALAIDPGCPISRGSCNYQSVVWICDECSKQFGHEIQLL